MSSECRKVYYQRRYNTLTWAHTKCTEWLKTHVRKVLLKTRYQSKAFHVWFNDMVKPSGLMYCNWVIQEAGNAQETANASNATK